MALVPNTRISRSGRRLLKRMLYSQMAFLDAFRVLFGRAEPRVSFSVKADPASVYWNFSIKEEQFPAFIDYINLPPDFQVCSIRCLAGESPEYILTLNVYEVTGMASGIRAEWSTYIRDHLGKARYMVLEAESSATSMDSVDIITRKSRVEHSTEGETRTLVEDLQGGCFTSHYVTSGAPSTGALDPEWLEANDYIYWRGGICDRVFYDSGLANPLVTLVDPEVVAITNNTHWQPFLEPLPRHVVQFQNVIEFVISPWENL
jgi:hypothetical protein